MYSLNRINTVADCDLLLTWAQKEKSDLLHKHYTVDRLTVNYGNTSVEIEAILQGVIAEINSNTTAIIGLPEGTTKEDMRKKIIRLEYRRFVLEERQESYGTVALLEKELDLERINKEINEVEAFITTVTAHKATL